MSRRAPAGQLALPIAEGTAARPRGGRADGMRGALATARNRLVLGGALFALAFATIAVRLVDVALVTDGFEPRAARPPAVSAAELARRDIVDRNGVLLATNLPTATLYAEPARVPDARATAARLAAVLPDLDPATVLARLTGSRNTVWLKRDLTPRQQKAVNRLGLPGLGFERAERRVYPLGRLAAHVVGYAGIDNQGLAGLERAFDAALRTATPGAARPLRLTLDVRIQYLVGDELARAIARFGAKGGAAIVMEANSAAVRAMVSLPDFDPNAVGEAPRQALFNRASQGAYEMGSTFKIFTAAMALDSGIASLGDRYDATRPIRIARFVIRDYRPENRWLTVPEVFVYSSNIGAARIAVAVGAAAQRRFLDRLGLLRPAAIEIPEVARPLLPQPWSEIATMTVGFGHGLAVSPLQLTAAVAAVVNGGVFHRPTLIAGTRSPGTRVILARTSAELRGLMRRVVEETTGRKAAVPGYAIGGKTGTAEKPGPNGYRRDALLSSFVAAFPIDRPRFVVFAMLDEPHGRPETLGYATAGWTAAPLVGRIIARLGPLAGFPAAAESGSTPREGLRVAF